MYCRWKANSTNINGWWKQKSRLLNLQTSLHRFSEKKIEFPCNSNFPLFLTVSYSPYMWPHKHAHITHTHCVLQAKGQCDKEQGWEGGWAVICVHVGERSVAEHTSALQCTSSHGRCMYVRVCTVRLRSQSLEELIIIFYFSTILTVQLPNMTSEITG